MDVVTTLNDVMPAVARVNEQLQALDLPALTERLAVEITTSGTDLRERLAGEIQTVTEPLNQVATRLETLPIEPKIQELDGKAAALQVSLARLEALPAEIAAVQVAQMRVEPVVQELDGRTASLQTSLAKLEALPAAVSPRCRTRRPAVSGRLAREQPSRVGCHRVAHPADRQTRRSLKPKTYAG